MIKALFFDLDGTLLNSEKKISPLTRRALAACKENGIQLYIATARPPLLERMLPWERETLSLFDGGLYYNGGCVVLGGRKTYLPIAGEVVRESIEQVCRYDALNIALQLEGEKHAFRFPLEEKGYRSWGVPAGEALALGQAANLRVIKILVFYANLVDSVTPVDREAAQALESLCLGRARFYLTDRGRCVQIMAREASKLSGVETMRRALGLAEQEIAVFGDDVNDAEMLRAYEHSVAMGNAESHVKSEARYVTLDNDSDGIHHALCGILHLVGNCGEGSTP